MCCNDQLVLLPSLLLTVSSCNCPHSSFSLLPLSLLLIVSARHSLCSLLSLRSTVHTAHTLYSSLPVLAPHCFCFSLSLLVICSALYFLCSSFLFASRHLCSSLSLLFLLSAPHCPCASLSLLRTTPTHDCLCSSVSLLFIVSALHCLYS